MLHSLLQASKRSPHFVALQRWKSSSHVFLKIAVYKFAARLICRVLCIGSLASQIWTSITCLRSLTMEILASIGRLAVQSAHHYLHNVMVSFAGDQRLFKRALIRPSWRAFASCG